MTVTTEVQNGSDTVSAFYKGIAAYISATGDEVDISTMDGTLTYDALLTYVQGAAQQGGSFAVGLGIEALSDYAAIQRELDLSRLVKTELMSSAAGELSDYAESYVNTSAYQIGVLNGTSTTGSQI